MESEELIKRTKNDYLEAKTSYVEVLHLSKKLDSDFLNLKLAFVAFISVIFTIVLGKGNLFSKHFIIILSTITLLAFLLLLVDFWLAFKSHKKSLTEMEGSAILANIRYISGLKIKEAEKNDCKEQIQKFFSYGVETEKLNEDNLALLKDMEEGLTVTKILNKRKIYFIKDKIGLLII